MSLWTPRQEEGFLSIPVRVFWVALAAIVVGCNAAGAEPPPVSTGGADLSTRNAPSRRAVLIGIDDYSASRFEKRPSPGSERDWANLSGAVNDVDAMQEMLVARYDFRPADILVLKNQAATREAILKAIDERLECASERGDIAFFYYAGHGSQVSNTKSSEPDKLDESLVPADARAGASDIRDKELRRRFNRILDRGARLTVLLDSCHSGSGARGLWSDARVRAVRPETHDAADREPEGARPEDRGALILSATQDYDRAHEARDDSGLTRGVFSWAWLRAMRSSTEGERAIDTFLRAQAMLRAETPYQEPVIAGNEGARFTPFLGTRSLAPGIGRTVALEEVQGDGTLILQGGWTHGLTVGSELRPANGESDLLLEVTAFRGLARCEARVKKTSAGASDPALAPGSLFKVAAWAAPPARPLRVWMSSIENAGAGTAAWARELARLAEQKGIRWIADPTEITPAYLLRLQRVAWELLGPGETVELFAASAKPAAILAAIPRGASLFVQIPASPALVKAIDIGPGTDRASIESVARPEDADYVLAGRLHRDELEYAWVRPSMTSRDQGRTPLPIRTAWHAGTEADCAGYALQDAAVRLRRIQGWQHLEGPAGAEAPYVLTILRQNDGAPARNALTGGEQYALALQPRGSALESRFIYVFTIDSHGTSILLFPLSGSVENRINGGPCGDDVRLDARFDIAEPYGTDTYFLLTTDEPLPDPWILEWNGVRGGSAPATPLEELLAGTGSATRSVRVVRTPATWSLERLLVESVPPRRARERP